MPHPTRTRLATVATAAAAAAVLLLGAGACSDGQGSDDRSGTTSAGTTGAKAATEGKSPEQVAELFLLAFAAKDAAGLCDVVLENGEPFPADERDACIERFEMDFAPAHAHDDAHEHGDEGNEGHGDEEGQFDEQLAALEQSAKDGPTSVGDEVDGQVEVTYPLDDAPLVVTLQKHDGSWYVAGTR